MARRYYKRAARGNPFAVDWTEYHVWCAAENCIERAMLSGGGEAQLCGKQSFLSGSAEGYSRVMAGESEGACGIVHCISHPCQTMRALIQYSKFVKKQMPQSEVIR